MYWAHGFWKIGHVSWVHGQPEICCAGVGSHAMHPSEIPAHEQWYEHKDTGAGRDFGSDPKDFRPQPGQVHVVKASGGGGDTQCVDGGGASHGGGGSGGSRGAKGTWAQYSNIDMCGQGDVEIIGDWKRTHSIDDLKCMVEERGYSAFTMSAGQPSFGHAALKRFPFELSQAHCKPISTCCHHPCTIYI